MGRIRMDRKQAPEKCMENLLVVSDSCKLI